MTHICISKLTIIGSDNGLSPGQRQAIIWTKAGILLIGPLGTNFREILFAIQKFSLRKKRLKMSSAKRQPFCLGLNVLMQDHFSPFSLLPYTPRIPFANIMCCYLQPIPVQTTAKIIFKYISSVSNSNFHLVTQKCSENFPLNIINSL